MNPAPSEHDAASADPTLSYLVAEDHHRIPLRHWPVSQPRGVITIAHGMSEHSGCYADVAARFNAAGYAVMAHDHRCHGLAVKPEYLGCVNEVHNWENICADMRTVNLHAQKTYPGLPIILLGHSMGSFISLAYVQRHSHTVDAFLIEGTNYEPPWFTWLAHLFANFEVNRQGINGRSAVIHALTFGKFARAFKPRHSDYDWLSRDRDFVQRYLDDPLCGVTCSNGFWRDLLEGLSKAQRMSNLRKIRKDLPIYSFAGDKDPVGKDGVSVAEFDDKLETAGLMDVTLKIYEGARHDLLHETNRDEVFADLLGWLEASLSRISNPVCELKPPHEHPAWLSS